ncbi:hypothetical protein EON65_45225 [archaeon]|nr:MAG: hypothetical protein EON65_45225 [archaeon]
MHVCISCRSFRDHSKVVSFIGNYGGEGEERQDSCTGGPRREEVWMLTSLGERGQVRDGTGSSSP